MALLQDAVCLLDLEENVAVEQGGEQPNQSPQAENLTPGIFVRVVRDFKELQEGQKGRILYFTSNGGAMIDFEKTGLINVLKSVFDKLEVDSDEVLRQKALRRKSNLIVLMFCVVVASAAAAAAAMAGIKSDGIAPELPPVPELIRDAALTAAVAGFAPAPVYFLNVKGYGNFIANTVLTMGSKCLKGRDAVLEVLRAPARMKLTSAAFQTLGLASAAYGFVSLAAATRPWASWARWQQFGYLVTQHAGAVNVQIGLGNNLAMATYTSNFGDFGYNEPAVAKGLVALVLVVGGPVWAAQLSAGWCGIVGYLVPAGVLAALGGVSFCKLLTGKSWNGAFNLFFDGNSGSRAMILSFGTVFFLGVLWLGAAVTSWDSWHLAGATFLELSLPLLVGSVLVLLASGEEKPEIGFLVQTYTGFVVAMNLTYLNSMLMPAGQLAADGAGYGAAPAEAFMAKKGAVFVNATFVAPAQKALAAADPGNATAAAWAAQVALSQLAAFCT